MDGIYIKDRKRVFLGKPLPFKIRIMFKLELRRGDYDGEFKKDMGN